MRGFGVAGLVLGLIAGVSGATAQEPGFAGKWSLSGQIIGGGRVYSFAQTCDVQQTGDQIAGACQGPNGGCSLVGVLGSAGIDMTCRSTKPGVDAFSTFHGALAAGGTWRGSVNTSRLPGATGVFAMMRI